MVVVVVVCFEILLTRSLLQVQLDQTSLVSMYGNVGEAIYCFLNVSEKVQNVININVSAPSCRKKKVKQFLKENGCRSRKLVSNDEQQMVHFPHKLAWENEIVVVFGPASFTGVKSKCNLLVISQTSESS